MSYSLAVVVSAIRGLPEPPASDDGLSRVEPYVTLKVSSCEGVVARSPVAVTADTTVPLPEQVFALNPPFQSQAFAPVAEGDTLTVEVWNNDPATYGSSDAPLGQFTVDVSGHVTGAPKESAAEWSTISGALEVELGFRAQPAAVTKSPTPSPPASEPAVSPTPEAQDSAAVSAEQSGRQDSSARRDSEPTAAQNDERLPPVKPAKAETRDAARSPRRPATQRSTRGSSRASPSAATARSSTLDSQDILRPSYRLLSTVPHAPAAGFTPRRTEPRQRTTVVPPGPNKYHHDLSWVRPGAKIAPVTPRSVPPKEAPAPPMRDVRPQWGAKPISFGFRPSTRSSDKAAMSSPGPGVYSPENFGMASEIDKRNRLNTVACTFGSPRRPPKYPNVPGPASYAGEVIDTKNPNKHMTGALMAGRVKPPQPYLTPGPGEYRIKSFVDDEPGRIPQTFKGRLPHPMDAKLAEFEAAKTSCPRLPNRTMRARPRL